MALSPVEATPTRFRFLRTAALMAAVFLLLGAFCGLSGLADIRLYRELIAWLVTGSLLWLYWQGYQAVKTGDVPMSWLVGSAVIIAVAALLVPPFHSTDVFGYINRGWQQVHYGANPYVHTVDDMPGWEHDPMITDHWVNNPSPYGFLYLLIARLLSGLGGGDKALTVLAFKGFNLLVHLGIAALVWQGARRLNARRPHLALYLYAWNPLILVHALSNGHNDIVMGFFVTLSAFFAVIGAWLWVLPALTAATLIKYGALVVIPPAVLLLIKHKAWRGLLGGVLFSLAVVGLSGWPYLPDWQAFRLNAIERNAFVSHGSLHSMVYTAYKSAGKLLAPAWYEHKETARAVLKNALLLVYMVFYGWLGISRLRQAQYPAKTWIHDALLVMGVMVCLISLKFYPWYLGMFFPLALYLPEGHWLRRLMVVLSGTQLLALTFIGQAHMLNFILMTALPVVWMAWQQRKTKNTDDEATVVPYPPVKASMRS